MPPNNSLAILAIYVSVPVEMATNVGLAGLVSSERLVLSLAIALAFLALACTVWGCRGCRSLGGPGSANNLAASGRWGGRRDGALEGFAETASAASASAETASAASVSAASVSAGPAVVASPGVVVPPLVIKDRRNEAPTVASRTLEKRILSDGMRQNNASPGEGRLR